MSEETFVAANGDTVFICPADGARITDTGSALDLIGDAAGSGATVVAVPVERVGEEFFSLRSGLAGEVVQKFTQYGTRLAVLGDISAHVEQSNALRDFVREANRGRHVWFVESRKELEDKLSQARPLA